MKKHILLSLLMTTQVMAQSQYNEAKELLASAPTEVKSVMQSAPSTYSFKSQIDGKNSVSYTGQTFRLVLINDLKAYMGSIKRGNYVGDSSDAMATLNTYFEFDYIDTTDSMDSIGATSEFQVTAKHLNGEIADITEGFFYGDLKGVGKNLKQKIAGNDNALRRGKLYGTTLASTPEAYVQVLFKEFTNNAVDGQSFLVPNGSLAKQRVSSAGVTRDGRDLTQLTQKFFHGAVSFSQAARDYLSTDLSAKKGLNAQNENPYKPGKSYTSLEHHFDEGFGYFGAAVDYKNYTHTQIAKKLSVDTDNDGEIAIQSEMNLGLAVNSAKRDLGAMGGANLKNEVITAFLQGRHLITSKPANYKKYVVASANVALGAWEKTIASTAVHYINKTIKEMNEYGTEDYLYTNFAKYWSELKGFSMAFQFSPTSMLSDEKFDKLHSLLGEAPTLPSASSEEVKAYQAQLLQARSILKEAYSFSETNVNHW